VTTTIVDEHASALAAATPAASAPRPELAGARVDRRDPLAVLGTARPPSRRARPHRRRPRASPGAVVVRAPMQGTIVAVDVGPGDAVPQGRSSSSWRR
jgi:biotin carboxyl carrier protein